MVFIDDVSLLLTTTTLFWEHRRVEQHPSPRKLKIAKVTGFSNWFPRKSRFNSNRSTPSRTCTWYYSTMYLVQVDPSSIGRLSNSLFCREYSHVFNNTSSSKREEKERIVLRAKPLHYKLNSLGLLVPLLLP